MLLLLILCGSIYAQIPSVAGVSLGDPYDITESTLEKRYGSTIGKEYNKITYYDMTVGGYTYNFATFEFSYVMGERRLNLVELSRHFELSELSRAKQFRDNIAETYARKYTDMDSFTDENGFKLYRCFLNRSKKYYNILITLSKGKSRGGDTFYYVNVSYGPWFMSETPDDI